MTDLKNLLDNAAGDEPATTDDQLAADLRRGQTSLRRRRITGVVAATAATALVVGGGWTLLPDAVPTGTTFGPGVAATTAKSSARPSPTTSARHGRTTREAVPTKRPNPVRLVANAARPPGSEFVCSLKPTGWTVEKSGNGLRMYDPKVEKRDGYYLGVYWTLVMPDGSLPKYMSDQNWASFHHYQAGSYQAVINEAPRRTEPPVPLSGNGDRQIYLKLPGMEATAGDKLIDVQVVPRLGWDLATALRFAGSCRPT